MDKESAQLGVGKRERPEFQPETERPVQVQPIWISLAVYLPHHILISLSLKSLGDLGDLGGFGGPGGRGPPSPGVSGSTSLGIVPSLRTEIQPRLAVSLMTGPSPTTPLRVAVRPSDCSLICGPKSFTAPPRSAVASSWKVAFSGSSSSILPEPERAWIGASGSLPGVISISPRSVSSSTDWVNCSSLMSRARLTRRMGPTMPVAVNPPRSMLMLPGTACALNSVPRVPSNCSGFG